MIRVNACFQSSIILDVGKTRYFLQGKERENLVYRCFEGEFWFPSYNLMGLPPSGLQHCEDPDPRMGVGATPRFGRARARWFK
jgi:hypothetical protein